MSDNKEKKEENTNKDYILGKNEKWGSQPQIKSPKENEKKS